MIYPLALKQTTMKNQPILEIEVIKTRSGYEAVEASGARTTSGNPYVTVVNLLDSMTEDNITFDVAFHSDDSDESH